MTWLNHAKTYSIHVVCKVTWETKKYYYTVSHSDTVLRLSNMYMYFHLIKENSVVSVMSVLWSEKFSQLIKFDVEFRSHGEIFLFLAAPHMYISPLHSLKNTHQHEGKHHIFLAVFLLGDSL